MTELTKEKAIELSIAKWEILSKTGEYKRYFPEFQGEYEFPYGCSLCAFAGQALYGLSISRYRCRKYCPYAKKFRCCCNRSSPYLHWDSVTPHDPTSERAIELRKKYASEFLEQLKQLQDL